MKKASSSTFNEYHRIMMNVAPVVPSLSLQKVGATLFPASFRFWAYTE
jgi:hypothetical protein